MTPRSKSDPMAKPASALAESGAYTPAHCCWDRCRLPSQMSLADDGRANICVRAGRPVVNRRVGDNAMNACAEYGYGAHCSGARQLQL